MDGRYQVHYLPRFAVDKYYGDYVHYMLTDRDELVDWLYKPFQAPGAHVADYSKPVKTGEENRLHAGLPRPSQYVLRLTIHLMM